MVQIVGQEGLGDVLGQGLGQGLSSGLQMLLQAKMKGMQDLQDIKSIAGMGQQKAEPGGAPRQYTTEELIFAEKKAPGSAKILMEQQKKGEEEFAKVQETKGISSSASEMLKNIKYTGPLKLLTYNKETREARQNFNTLALELEKKAADMVGKGTLNKERFKFLKERLPSASKTQSENMGALKAWNKILNLDMPEFSQMPGETEELTLEEQIDLKNAPRAINRQTGQKLILQNGQWKVEK